VLSAALALYGRAGWQGFNLDAVARGAEVSKDAMYRRWKSRDALLADALRERWTWVAAIDTGTIRDDLLALTARTFETFTGAYGEVALQLRADVRRFADVAAFADPYRAMMVQQGRAIVRRAIARGELPARANPGVILDLLVGGVVNHVISTPPPLRERMLAEVDVFITMIVDVVLQGTRSVLS